MRQRCVIAILGLAMVFMGTAVYGAEGNLNQGVKGNLVSQVVVNGQALTGCQVYAEDEVIMVPLRAVGEALGFAVSWNHQGQWVELTRGELSATVLLEREGYSKNKGTYLILGKAPQVVANQAYVPVAFVETYLEAPYQVSAEGILVIGNQAPVEQLYIRGYIQSVRADGSLLVCGKGTYGEVVLHLDNKTVILDEDGQVVGAKALTEGRKIEGDYGPMVTKSIPPEGTAQEIRLLKEESSLVGVIEASEGNSIIVKGASSNFGQQVKLIIQDETVIVDEKGGTLSPQDLLPGMVIKAAHSSLATFSLPPQTEAYRIEVMIQ